MCEDPHGDILSAPTQPPWLRPLRFSVIDPRLDIGIHIFLTLSSRQDFYCFQMPTPLLRNSKVQVSFPGKKKKKKERKKRNAFMSSTFQKKKKKKLEAISRHHQRWTAYLETYCYYLEFLLLFPIHFPIASKQPKNVSS